MEDISIIIVGILALIVLGAVIYVIVKHHGEKKQNDMELNNRREEQGELAKPGVGIREINAYLAKNTVDHQLYETWILSLNREYDISRNRNEQPESTLVERMHSLDDTLEWHIKDDKQWLKQVPDEDRDAVAAQLHHDEWRAILADIRQKVGPSPRK